uniref:Uncharacterized protein n=1 Tax=Anopheles dirus TaxID=7168 RepID=A0A182NFU1_9DIPT
GEREWGWLTVVFSRRGGCRCSTQHKIGRTIIDYKSWRRRPKDRQSTVLNSSVTNASSQTFFAVRPSTNLTNPVQNVQAVRSVVPAGRRCCRPRTRRCPGRRARRPGGPPCPGCRQPLVVARRAPRPGRQARGRPLGPGRCRPPHPGREGCPGCAPRPGRPPCPAGPPHPGRQDRRARRPGRPLRAPGPGRQERRPRQPGPPPPLRHPPETATGNFFYTHQSPKSRVPRRRYAHTPTPTRAQRSCKYSASTPVRCAALRPTS